ncbi:MAG: hypothetical protein EXS00_07930 [Phycisphaerales bacterium]|nr:hypothetical protein [Phycisphaerales bacterium]
MRSVHAFMSSILDYAGLYPPASHDASTVVSNYAAHLASANSWMLGRLIWPVARLHELSDLAAAAAPVCEPPLTEGVWAISAVTVPVDDAGFAADLAAIESFNQRHSAPGAPALRIDALEAKASGAVAIERALRGLPEDVYPYFELACDSDPRGAIAALADMDAGAKIRTGGANAAAFPSAEALSKFITACNHARVPFKATAGLHRAMRHFDASTLATHFGFFNVFIGACLLHSRKIDGEALTMLLEDDSLESFELSESIIGWRGERMQVADIELSRSRFAHSFGSCSFAEPLHDLVQLELIRGEIAK